jgi:hypothetical protein
MSDARDTSTDVVQFDDQTESGIGENARDEDSGSSLAIESVRDRRDEAIEQAFSTTDPVLIEALPSIGKSYGLIKWADDTGNPLAVFTSRTKLYKQYADWCEERGLSYYILPSMFRHCETAKGEHGEGLEKFVKQNHSQDLSPIGIHRKAKKQHGENLPCQHNGNCTYFEKRDFTPEKYDVLIGHHKHSHVPDYVEDRSVAFDEFPENDFLQEFTSTEVNLAVRGFLDQNPDFPGECVKDLKEYRHNPVYHEQGRKWFVENNPEIKRDATGVFNDKNGSAHALAGAMAYAILIGDDLDNRWEYAELPNNWRAVQNPYTESLTLLTPPSLENAASVIGLDGTPTLAKWRLILRDSLQRKPLLSLKEKQNYFREALNLRLIQTRQAANHYSGKEGISVTPKLDTTVFEAIKTREGKSPTIISSKTALQKYRAEGIEEIASTTRYYGDFKGENKFSTTRVGIVAGSSHYGDEYLEKWAALCGYSISRAEETRGMGQNFGEAGNELLHGMRENEVLQAAMRFGRDGNGATVYLHTSALPEWVPVERRLSNTAIDRWSDGMKEIHIVLKYSGKSAWETKEIADQVTISERQVRSHLNKLAKYGYLDRHQEGRGHVWTDASLDQIRERGHVDFSDTVE